MSVRSRLAAAFAPPTPPAPPATRLDATESSASSYSGAAVQNAISGVGGYRDSGATARPNVERDFLDVDELVALLRGGLYRRICELHPSWATIRGWHITDDTAEESPLSAEMEALDVRGVFRRADTWARALGESRVLMVTDDPDPLDAPLRPAKVRRLLRLEVFDRREFFPVHYNDDIMAGPLGEPDVYSIAPRRASYALAAGGRSLARVHASRLLRFYGDDLPPSELGFASGDSIWGADAVGQTLWDAIRNLSQMGAAGARVAQELSIAVFKIAPPKASADESASWLGRMRTLNMMKSVVNAVLLSPGEDFQRIAANPTGYADLSTHARLELSLLIGAPMTLLFGEAPGGLNTDGSSWQALWYQAVAAHQDGRYRRPLRQLAEVLYHSTRGGTPEQWGIEFEPLGDLSEKERAEIRLIHTQADSASILDGVLTPDEIRRQRYTQPGGYRFSMQPLEEDADPDAALPADPAAEADAQRMVEEAMAERAAKADRLDGYPADFRRREFVVPEAARNNARRVLDWRREHRDEVQGMTPTGWARARQLAAGEVTGQDVVEIAAWFARHAGSEEVSIEYKAAPWKDAGHVAHLGWGGDTAKTWAKGIADANRE